MDHISALWATLTCVIPSLCLATLNEGKSLAFDKILHCDLNPTTSAPLTLDIKHALTLCSYRLTESRKTSLEILIAKNLSRSVKCASNGM
uniref:Secreted protein n=1 Tax=Ciona intestinalis TaxID=7719 RepID=F6S9E1_CIOIN